MNRWFALASFLWCLPAAGAAQDTTTIARDTTVAHDTTAAARPTPTVAAVPASAVTLSLDDALKQARANSPAYRQVLNDAAPARWAVRNAYGNLLPQLNVSSDLGYIGSGQSNVGGGFIQSTSAFLTSDYNLGVVWQLDGRALSGPGQQKALQHATDEDISGAGITLRADIETQYLNSLQATAQVGVARQQVSRNADFLALAKARYQVGQATLLDVRQAEVIKGQSDVSLLRAVQAENEAKLDLVRRMGVEPPVPIEQIVLSDSFPVTAPGIQPRLPARAGRRAEPRATVTAGAPQRGDVERAGGQVRVSSDAVGPGRVEWLHPAVHQHGAAAQSDARRRAKAGQRLPVQQPGPDLARSRR